MAERTAARAIAWEFRRRHRWGFIALAVYLLVLAAIKLSIVSSGVRVTLESGESFATVVVVPLTASFLYILTVFSFGSTGDMAGRQSLYPARMYTLPVTSRALAGWPMLFGSIAIVTLWLVSRLLILWPTGMAVPVIWPAVAAAALLAWAQALTWMPYGLRGLRVAFAMLWLVAIDTLAIVAVELKVPEIIMIAVFLPQIPLAYLTANIAVSRARRGDVPDWSGAFSRAGAISRGRANDQGDFPSAARAQFWFEWRRHGRMLPLLVSIVLPAELALLFLAHRATPAFLTYTMIGAFLTPPLMAVFVAASVRKANPFARDSYGVTTFIATRPLTSAELIAAKLQMTVWSTLAAWAVAVVAVPLAILLSDSWPLLERQLHPVVRFFGRPRAIAFALLVLAGLVGMTWKQLVQSLYVGLSGREGLVRASVFLTFATLFAIGPIATWVAASGSAKAALWDAVLWLPPVLVIIKMSVATWIATRLYRTRLLSDRALLAGAATWCVAVLAFYGVLVWFFSTPFLPRFLLAFVAILLIPLARVSAAPLALAWNRHR